MHKQGDIVLILKALPKDALEYAENHIACWRAAYRGIMTDEYLDNMPIEQITERNQQVLSDSGMYMCYYLWVLEANSRARRFYEKCGFTFDGTQKEINIDKPLVEMRYNRSL